MEIKAEIRGLDEAMEAMMAVFPKSVKQQKSLLNSAMKASAKENILPSAKRRALRGDGSGALSEALDLRNQRVGKIRMKGITTGVEITPVRSNRRAMAMYISHYYTSRGRKVKPKMILSGIRHGHLVEFGTKKMRARPYLYPATQSKKSAYVDRFASWLKKRTEAAVARKARANKAKSKRRAPKKWTTTINVREFK